MRLTNYMSFSKNLTTIALCLLGGFILKGDQVIYQENFTNGVSKWKVRRNSPSVMTLDSKKYPEGKTLKLDGSKKVTACYSPKILLKPDTRYKLTFKSWSERYAGWSVGIQIFDADNHILSIGGSSQSSGALWEPKKKGRKFWMPAYIHFDTGKKAAYARIKIYKSKGPFKCWFTDFQITRLDKRELLPSPVHDPQSPPYTANSLMLPGPDGFLYPNWTQAGLHEYPPKGLPVYKLEDFGAVANDGKDDSDALDKAIAAADKSNGGIIRFGAGKYNITRMFLITSNNTILQGTGKKQTIVEFGLPANKLSVLFFGTRINGSSKLEAYFPKANAEKATVYFNGKEVASFASGKFIKLPDEKEFSSIVFKCKQLKNIPESGYCKFKVEVKYKNAKTKSTTISVKQNNTAIKTQPGTVICFAGKHPSRKEFMVGGAKRGENKIRLRDVGNLKAGDYVRLKARQTERWNKLTYNECPWGDFRTFLAKISSVSGNELTLSQPLRIDFPAVDKPYVIVSDPLRCCGIKDMTIRQTGKIQIEMKLTTVTFISASNCFAENMRIERPGTRAIYFSHSKWSTMKDCEFTAPWRTKILGLAYVGFDYSWDCLIERVKSEKMRHAPMFNWSCSGNVIRDCYFFESDAQWHSGWCRDNLLEQCKIITNTRKHGSYGWGFFTTPTDDAMHGANGPRNVVYNCYSESSRGAFHMGGMNRRWMVMYSTMTATNGPGILQRLGCQDNIIHGNVFVLKNPNDPMIYYEYLDNTGDQVTGNTIYGGNGKLFAGPGKPSVYKDNRFLPLKTKPTPAKAPVPSIYLWQKEKYSAGKKVIIQKEFQ